jgi:hypothetical protein
MEGGLDPNLTKEEFLDRVGSAAKDLSDRSQFNPFYLVLEGRKSWLLFTDLAFAQRFAQIYVREVKRIMPFQVVGVKGSALVRHFGGTYSFVLNAGSEFQYGLSAEDMTAIRELWADPTSHQDRP